MNTENNKLIAEFMKYKISENKECFKLPDKNGWINLNIFHSDWNWLMEVVEKIESILMPETDNCFNVCIGPGLYCTIQDSYGDLIEINHSSKKKIKAVYKACVEFIKWYNLNKNQYE